MRLLLLLALTAAAPVKERPLGLTSLTTQLSKTKLSATGEIPTWLSGTLVRNGPALFNVGDKYVSHWFDGSAMLHSFQFDSGKIFYQNKFLETSQYKEMTSSDSFSFSGFFQGGKKSEGDTIPNANVNVAFYANQHVALTEVPLPVRFNLDTLETLGTFSYDDTLPKSKIWDSAHPHVDAKDGTIINYMVQFFPQTQYVIYTMKKGSNQRETLAQVPVKEPAYMHSFAITENYVVLVEFPLFINPQDLQKGGSFASHYKWMPERKMRILLLSRKNGELVKEFLVEPIFAWHHINSFEQKDSLIIDMAGYKNADTFTSTVDVSQENDNTARFIRYKLGINSKEVFQKEIGPSIEMPRINYARSNGKPYDYVWGYDDSQSVEKTGKRGLIKIDTATQFAHTWSEDNCIADEPVFVAKPNAESEDDGVILAPVLDTKKKKSFLLILDAKKFKEIARAEVPHHIPYTLHGEYISNYLQSK